MKPENIIIDKQGYIKLTDFGLAKENIYGTDKSHEFCGTPEYLAPDFFSDDGYGKEVDFWALGVLLYEMICGCLPFFNPSKEKLFQEIMNPKITYPSDISPEAICFFRAIFTVDPKNRLGSGGINEIKDHAFFRNINWDDILNKRIKPPFLPRLETPDQTKYVDEMFLKESPKDSYSKGDTLDSKEDQFLHCGFSFDHNIGKCLD